MIPYALPCVYAHTCTHMYSLPYIYIQQMEGISLKLPKNERVLMTS